MKMNRHVCRRIPLCLQNMGFNFRHCKLFHCNGVLFDQNAVTFENILSEENKLRVLKALQKYDLPSLRKVTVAGDHRKAAVLIPLCSVKGEPSILFMVRSNKIPAHRGEVSFPGGMMDDTDHDLITTALRETQEEIGLRIPREAVWGSFQSLPSRVNGKTLVTPIIASIGELQNHNLHLNKTEVERVFTRTISSLCDRKNVGSTQFKRGKLPSLKSGYTLPVYLGGEHRIWGLTAITLHMLLPILAPGLYKFNLLHKN